MSAAARRKRVAVAPARNMRSKKGVRLTNGLTVRLSEDPTTVWIPEEVKGMFIVPGALTVTSSEYTPKKPPHHGGPGFEITLTEHDQYNADLVLLSGHLRDVADGRSTAAITLAGVVNIHELDQFLDGLTFAIREARERLALSDRRAMGARAR